MLSKIRAALAAAAILPLLNGCGLDSVNQGQVRLVNATSEYTTLELDTEDSDGATSALISGTTTMAASGYTGVDNGSVTFDVKGGTSAGVAAQVTGSVSTDKHYTVVASISGSTLTATFLSDEDSAPSSGNAKLRIFNTASTEAGGVDVYLTTSECGALQVTDTALASNVTGLQTSYSQVSAAAAGTDWHVCVTATGDKGSLRLDIPKLTLKDQEIATLVLTRTAGGVLLNAAVLDQQGTFAGSANSISRMRVVADAASQATVSATINGTSLSASAASPIVGDYQTIASGDLTAAIQIGGVDINGVSLPAATAGTDYTLLVAGTAGAPSITLITDDNTPSTSATAPVKARFVNGLNGIGGTASASVDGKLIGSGISFAAASAYTTIPASTGTATVNVTANGAAVDPLTLQSFSSGGVYTVFLLGDSAAPTIVQSVDR
jgi:hypothetical protein